MIVRKTFGPRIAIVLALVLMTHGRTAAQTAVFPEDNSRSLTGVRAFDGKVAIFTWLNMPEDRARFLNQADSIFRAGLTRTGVAVDPGAPNYLFCELWLAEASGLIAYAWNVSYYLHELAGVHRLEWRTGGMVTVGRNNFNAQSVATACIDAFTREWHARNP